MTGEPLFYAENEIQAYLAADIYTLDLFLQKKNNIQGCHKIVSVLEYPSVTNKCL